MKSKIFLLWVILLSGSMVFAQSGTDGTVTWSLSNGTLTIGGSGDMKAYNLGTTKVPWSNYKSQIINVNVQGVTSIGSYSFYECTNLQSVTIGNNIRIIGPNAFYGCNALLSVVIPGSVDLIGSSAFYGCSAMKTLTLNNATDRTMDIETEAFRGCSSLTSVILPGKVYRIGSSAFYGCTNIESVTIGANANEIKSNAFAGCTKLTTLYYNMDKSLAYVEDGTLYSPGWNNITNIVFGSNVKTILKGMFQGCTKLTSIVFPNSVENIQPSAFRNCSGLTSITFGSRLGQIWDYAFYGCTELTTITIPSAVTHVGGTSFGNCSKLTTLQLNATDWTHINLRNIPNLTDVTIGNSVTNIPTGIFSGCKNLINITVSAGNPIYASEDNVLFNKNKTALVCYPPAKQGAYIIPGGVSSIAESAFSGSGLTFVSIPNSVIEIGQYAFAGSGLQKVHISSGVQSVADYAFSNCSNLTEITFPSTFKSIGRYAFNNCTSLTQVTIPASVTNIAERAFTGCIRLEKVNAGWKETLPTIAAGSATNSFYGLSLSNIILRVSYGTAELYKAAYVWKDFKIESIELESVVSATSVKVSWYAVENVASYKLTVYSDKENTQIVGTYDFDTDGNPVTRSTEADDKLNVQITGLSPETAYYYKLEAFDNSEAVIDTFREEFVTLSTPTGIDVSAVSSDPIISSHYFDFHGRIVKQPKSGHLYIVREFYQSGKTKTRKIMK